MTSVCVCVCARVMWAAAELHQRPSPPPTNTLSHAPPKLHVQVIKSTLMIDRTCFVSGMGVWVRFFHNKQIEVEVFGEDVTLARTTYYYGPVACVHSCTVFNVRTGVFTMEFSLNLFHWHISHICILNECATETARQWRQYSVHAVCGKCKGVDLLI